MLLVVVLGLLMPSKGLAQLTRPKLQITREEHQLRIQWQSEVGTICWLRSQQALGGPLSVGRLLPSPGPIISTTVDSFDRGNEFFRVLQCDPFGVPSYNRNWQALKTPAVEASREQAAQEMKRVIPGMLYEFGPGTSGVVVWTRDGALTPALDPLPSDVHLPTKQFLARWAAFFGHGPEVLTTAWIDRDAVGVFDGVRTTMWRQQVAGIPVFGAILSANMTRRAELFTLSSSMLANVEQAAENGVGGGYAFVLKATPVSPQEAVALAAYHVGEELSPAGVEAVDPEPAGAVRRQRFRSVVLREPATAELVWSPTDPKTIRLCWSVIVAGRSTFGISFLVLLDAITGEIVFRDSLTVQ